MSKRIRYTIAVIVLMSSMFACQLTSQNVATVSNQQATPEVSLNEITETTAPTATQAPTKTLAPTSVDTPTEVPTAEPSATPEQEPEGLVLLEKTGFYQDGTEVKVFFLFENPFSDQQIVESQYVITLLNKSGKEIKVETGTIEIVPPATKLAGAPSIYLDDEVEVDKAEVKLITGTIEPAAEEVAVFSVDTINYFYDETFPTLSVATGVVTNSAERDFTSLEVVAILYNEEGEIIGGGFNYVAFIPANGSSAASIYAVSNEVPAKTEIYASLHSLYFMTEDNSQNQSVKLVETGFSQSDFMLYAGVVVQNTSDTDTIQSSQYEIAAYDQDGTVLGVTSGYINMLFPNEKQGIFNFLSLPSDTQAERVEILLYPGEPQEYELASNPFTAVSTEVSKDIFGYTVKGTLKNSHTKPATYVEVNVVAYDAEGSIIGGGSTYVDLVEAGGEAAFEVSLTLNQEPDHVEIYPQITSLTSFE